MNESSQPMIRLKLMLPLGAMGIIADLDPVEISHNTLTCSFPYDFPSYAFFGHSESSPSHPQPKPMKRNFQEPGAPTALGATNTPFAPSLWPQAVSTKRQKRHQNLKLFYRIRIFQTPLPAPHSRPFNGRSSESNLRGQEPKQRLRHLPQSDPKPNYFFVNKEGDSVHFEDGSLDILDLNSTPEYLILKGDFAAILAFVPRPLVDKQLNIY